MKKKFFIIILLISTFLNILLIFQISNRNQEIKNAYIYNSTYDYLDSLTVNSFEKLYQSGETLYIYIGRPDCNDCNFFEPLFYSVLNKYQLNATFKYINVKKYRSEDLKRWEKFKGIYNFSQTPVLLIIKNKQVIDKLEWSNEGILKDDIMNLLYRNKLIR